MQPSLLDYRPNVQNVVLIDKFEFNQTLLEIMHRNICYSIITNLPCVISPVSEFFMEYK